GRGRERHDGDVAGGPLAPADLRRRLVPVHQGHL
ncbi:MAG: hypothetical protein AVDCRST_MAG10-585, partial [uncultured Acidimicrobiales bacterium]